MKKPTVNLQERNICSTSWKFAHGITFFWVLSGDVAPQTTILKTIAYCVFKFEIFILYNLKKYFWQSYS